MPDDPVRDANVKSFNRLVSVLQRVLKVDRTRISMSTKMAALGVDDNSSIKLMDALQKEFGVPFPAKLLLPTATVNGLVTYTALHVYNVDTSGTQVDQSSGPVSLEYLKNLEKEKQPSDGDTKTQQSPESTQSAVPTAPSPDSKPTPGSTSNPSPSTTKAVETK